jgi:GSH-dependent disulfide-bond oxidoreductase
MIDLYTAATINGRRAAIALAECGLTHRYHRLDLDKKDNHKPEFLRINSRGTIPVIADDEGTSLEPIVLTQSAAIVLYCAEKSRRCVPVDPRRRIEAMEWFMQAMTDVGPSSSAMFQSSLVPEQVAANTDYFEQRFLKNCTIVDNHLTDREYLAEEFSIADIALFPIVAARASQIEKAAGLDNLKAWTRRMSGREHLRSALLANG